VTAAPAFDMSDGLQQCIRCGMCLEACPTYTLTGLETESPRGRIHLMQAIFDGRIEPVPEARVHLDRCLACRACEAVCPSGVRYGRLIEETRASLAERDGPAAVRDALLWLVSRPRALAVAAALAAVPERLGLRALARRRPLSRLLPAGLRRLESLAPSLRRPRYRAPARPAAPTSRVALLLGCVMRVAYGDVHTATAALVARAGGDVVDVPGQTCCGALHAHAGAREEARRLARENIAAFERARVDTIVVDAAGCGAHLKQYGELLEEDDAWRERARAFAAKVRDVTEHLAETAGDGPLGELALRVTYQDPCHLAHAQRIRAQPRALLARVRGLELAELPDADVCCGSAGYYNLVQPEYADRLLADKVRSIAALAPDAVVTANPGCMLQLEAGLRAAGHAIPVLHVVEVLERAAR
jgi:glycolate oxidase iron-sulfur subunit